MSIRHFFLYLLIYSVCRNDFYTNEGLRFSLCTFDAIFFFLQHIEIENKQNRVSAILFSCQIEKKKKMKKNRDAKKRSIVFLHRRSLSVQSWCTRCYKWALIHLSRSNLHDNTTRDSRIRSHPTP